MKYLIGIDGGGTKTKCVVTDFELNKLYEYSGSASAFTKDNLDSIPQIIISLIETCKKRLNINYNDIKSIAVGLSGAGRKTDAEKIHKKIIEFAEERGIYFSRFKIVSDAEAALEGAFNGNAGSILICGTGSIMFGKDEKGNIHRVGGCGRIIGDEGGGYNLGRKGLIAAAKYWDGRGSKTELIKIISEEFNFENQQQLINEVYRNNFDIASFARFVINAAENGDEVCIKIVDGEIDELILHLHAMNNLLKVDPFNVALIGSILANENFYSKLFKEKAGNALSNLKFVKAEYPPEIGAALLAKKLLNEY
ncbi:MAG: hypothetical protein A2068_00680 [Ignavibacteria bacterium GWB2_35_6b]|nr:MAG: hypothetical protein A2068_00680 [Ignavibacteria bacterium GWB2_35_6b]